ncbi:heme exporter protein CcmD [Bartonella bacilliformis str. Heidi Mejia]|uniref:Heme exporter protein D n=2 Tax=Bartonella bacilliformis TaxID=774 RepID=A1UU83_BARBK|nr:heme exporter protein CcmD [Bartonella bacilliformis]ABM44773.1 heme exporter protein CcmD [Bartonella bacilliformis KC583]AMG86257.1 heme exporter protein CcmD [Bartonella bacilliformis]EKS43168.1 heme exporter protein CcmD [Bartonella bacilliformis INS]EYS88944.1 heme exporter protein CcmD [Bartonella bacilliformis San Pedro600-02]EYS90905.1 heme exporter protein CcmD [Bartonella bacilliformis str. Heidi Mejia]
MLDLNNIQNQHLENFSQRIDRLLGTLHHEQIVVLSYVLSAIILLCLIGHIIRKSAHQKKILQQLQTKELIWKEKYNENRSIQI